jgi:hypothetical protein
VDGTGSFGRLTRSDFGLKCPVPRSPILGAPSAVRVRPIARVSTGQAYRTHRRAREDVLLSLDATFVPGLRPPMMPTLLPSHLSHPPCLDMRRVQERPPTWRIL